MANARSSSSGPIGRPLQTLLPGDFPQRCQPIVDGFRRLRRRGLSVEHDITRAEPASIELLVAVLVLTYRSTLEADAGEEATRSRVAQDFGAKLNVGGGCRIAADRPR